MYKIFQSVALLATIAATFAAPPPAIEDIVRQTQLEILFREGTLADNSDAYLDTVTENDIGLQ